MSDQRQVPEGMALYKGEFVTTRMVVERLVEAERLLRNNAPMLPPKERREIDAFLRPADSADGGEK